MLCEMVITLVYDIIAMELEFVVTMILLLIGKQITIVPIQWVNLISLCDGRSWNILLSTQWRHKAGWWNRVQWSSRDLL